MGTPSKLTHVDGSLDFSGGVNSYVVPTVQSDRNPHGLKRSELSWMDNCTVRGGGITQRTGWLNNGSVLCQLGQYQGSFMYHPLTSEYPYLIASIGGRIYKIDPDDPAHAVDLSAQFGLINPPNIEIAYFEQAEQFLIIQAGDLGLGGPVIPGITDSEGNTLPLFWDGVNLWRSIGTNSAATQGQQNISFLPAATCMTYYMGRLWYAQGRVYAAGDIVGGPSGVLPNKSDAVLNVTENPLAVGGDGFTVPAGVGNIRALSYTANLNASLGEGQLIIFTRSEVFAMTVPVTRTDWIGAGSGTAPLQTVIQIGNGAVNQRSVVAVNGDLFFQSLEPSIRSLVTAVRYFDQWGNTSISINEQRILAFNNRSLMRFSSGILFDNRVLQCVLPQVCPVGVSHQAIVPLNFDVISTLATKLPPVWEGMYEGLSFLELSNGDFGGRERAFGFVWSDTDQAIQLWELTDFSKFENGDNRVVWYVEFPAFTFGDEFAQKRLVSCELWFDKIFGEVYCQMDYRPDGNPCWFPWHKWKMCTAKNTCEDVTVANPTPYCTDLRESFRQTINLPMPPKVCENVMGRPADLGFQFQCRLTIKGWSRIRGILLKGQPVEQKLYDTMPCPTSV